VALTVVRIWNVMLWPALTVVRFAEKKAIAALTGEAETVSGTTAKNSNAQSVRAVMRLM
jgi:hypothetical protein